MERTVTVSVKGLLVSGLVLVALGAAYLLGDAGGPAPAGATASPTAEDPGGAQDRTVVMSGSGEATAVPDEASFTVRVSVLRPDLDDALDAANATQKEVLDTLADHGVTKSDVQTTGLSMSPVYDYPAYSPPVLRGYRVTERARVHVTELKQAGRAISAAVAAGGNDVRVSDIRLEVGDPAAVLAEAREAAVDEATAKAEQYAAATGQTLGDVLSLREVKAPSARDGVFDRVSAYKYQAADLSAAVPIRAGEDELHVTVQIVWSFA